MASHQDKPTPLSFDTNLTLPDLLANKTQQDEPMPASTSTPESVAMDKKEKIVVPSEYIKNSELCEMMTGSIQRQAKYITKDSIELGKVADSQPWLPSEHIKEALKRPIEEFRVILINSAGGDLVLVEKTLVEQDNIGLVVLAKTIDRHHKPPLIALVTEQTIYVIDTNDLPCIEFLKLKLIEAKITFWTTQGQSESDCLLHNFGIELTEAKSCNDCLALHIYMMQTLANQSKPTRSLYPDLVSGKSSTEPKIESWTELVKIWLDIRPEDLKIELYQLNHLYMLPLSLTAQNIIKKRCVLVRELAGTLIKAIWEDSKRLSNSFHRRLSQIEDDALHNDRLKLVVASQSGNKIDDESLRSDADAFAHLSFGDF